MLLAHSEPHGAVVIASADQRFAKLARFLLDVAGHRGRCHGPPGRLLETLDERPDVVVLDAGRPAGGCARLANAARARRPARPS